MLAAAKRACNHDVASHPMQPPPAVRGISFILALPYTGRQIKLGATDSIYVHIACLSNHVQRGSSCRQGQASPVRSRARGSRESLGALRAPSHERLAEHLCRVDPAVENRLLGDAVTGAPHENAIEKPVGRIALVVALDAYRQQFSQIWTGYRDVVPFLPLHAADELRIQGLPGAAQRPLD